ncbi:hypothetical protein HPP92_003842 [Vanilla planifolia]|uniref:Uncharacterized protein n=1 Tax=Vanilla planifolia TaxID=51239 RepID=A0A835VJT7_VANPL|nr:hypothetical protein HPP92_003842 [Vanilla planifolia]
MKVSRLKPKKNDEVQKKLFYFIPATFVLRQAKALNFRGDETWPASLDPNIVNRRSYFLRLVEEDFKFVIAGMEDNALGTEDWLPSNRMPKTLFLDLIGESHGFRSIQDNALQRTSLAHLQESEELGIFANASKHDWQSGNEVPKELSIGLNPFDFPKSSYRGRLADRIAGRAGFGNLTVDTSQISTATSFSSPTTNVHSPLLTIPPGLSPAILLDSPIFLSNPLVEQLPTMVNAPSFEFSNVADTVVSNKTKDSPLEDIDLPSFAFKLPFPLFPNAEKKAALGSNHPQSLSTQGTCFHYPHQLNCQEEFPKPSAKKVDSGDALQEKGMSMLMLVWFARHRWMTSKKEKQQI